MGLLSDEKKKKLEEKKKITEESIGEEVSIIDGKYLYFGTYPQSAVVDDSTINALNALVPDKPTYLNFNGWTDYRYYVSNHITSYMWFKDLEYSGNKYRGVYFAINRPYHTNASDKSNQRENGYIPGTIYWFKFELIQWKILESSGKRKFIIADLILDCQNFDTDGFAGRPYYHNGGMGHRNNYEFSNIRFWLNKTFYDTAFTNNQRNLILTTEVDNSASSTGNRDNQYTCNDTNDNIFLLSYSEAKKLFSTDDKRKTRGTDYAKCQGLSCVVDDNDWWLRSPGSKQDYYVKTVDCFGEINGISCDTSSDIANVGVRPACWIIVR